MKWGFVCGLATALVFLMLSGFTTSTEAAEVVVSAPTPAIIYISIAPTEEPPPAPTATPTEEPEIVIVEHQLNSNDVETIARLLWSSPLRSKESKAALAWIVLNRVDSDQFPSTVGEVVTVGEFTFYDKRAHLSEENLQLVTLVMNQWLSEREGNNAGRLVPKTGLFIQFCGENNRNLTILDARGGSTVYYPMRGAYEY
ncbi:MAG: cell wall hydrolase [Clostridia bacterium]